MIARNCTLSAGSPLPVSANLRLNCRIPAHSASGIERRYAHSLRNLSLNLRRSIASRIRVFKKKGHQPQGLPHPLIHAVSPLTVCDCQAILIKKAHFTEFIKNLDLYEYDVTPAGLAGVRRAPNIITSADRYVDATLGKNSVPPPEHPLVYKAGQLTLTDCQLVSQRSEEFIEMLTYFDPSGRTFNIAAPVGYQRSVTLLADTLCLLQDAIADLASAAEDNRSVEKQ